MIGYLNGSVAWIDDDVCIIDVGGVGYQVYCTRPSLEQLKYYRGKAEQVKLYTRLIHREDVFDLYGFLSRDEYKLFNMLIKVSGIGPRQGLKILGIDSPERIIGAIAGGDEAFLTRLPGIGSKKARQIILELKDKLERTYEITEPSVPGLMEALQALENLGFSPAEARKAAEKAMTEGHSETSDIIQNALRYLSI